MCCVFLCVAVEVHALGGQGTISNVSLPAIHFYLFIKFIYLFIDPALHWPGTCQACKADKSVDLMDPCVSTLLSFSPLYQLQVHHRWLAPFVFVFVFLYEFWGIKPRSLYLQGKQFSN